MIRVMLVDDHAVVREGLRQLLLTDDGIQVVGEAGDGATAIRLAKEIVPDVIIMDLIMPEMDGVATISSIIDLEIPSKILALTSVLEDQLIKRAIQAGAQGYLLKASCIDDVVSAIYQVAAGQTALDTAVTQALIRQTRLSDPLDLLTNREREVFDLIAQGKNNHEISQLLVISEVTVRTHVASLLDKIQLRDRTQVIIYALKRGLVRVEDLP